MGALELRLPWLCDAHQGGLSRHISAYVCTQPSCVAYYFLCGPVFGASGFYGLEVPAPGFFTGAGGQDYLLL